MPDFLEKFLESLSAIDKFKTIEWINSYDPYEICDMIEECVTTTTTTNDSAKD